jgi:hypothetical protein
MERNRLTNQLGHAERKELLAEEGPKAVAAPEVAKEEREERGQRLGIDMGMQIGVKSRDKLAEIREAKKAGESADTQGIGQSVKEVITGIQNEVKAERIHIRERIHDKLEKFVKSDTADALPPEEKPPEKPIVAKSQVVITPDQTKANTMESVTNAASGAIARTIMTDAPADG